MSKSTKPAAAPKNRQAAYLVEFYRVLAGRRTAPGDGILEECHAAARKAQAAFDAKQAIVH